jgi:RNA polymerase sigma factor (sigma-70 family)
MAKAGINAEQAGMDEAPADDVLLERFTARREQTAFAALVRRHGPLVLGVCRRLLRHEQDAEDAFQAVFCVLARKASGLRRGPVGAWLYAVAWRIARKAKASQMRRRMRESELPDVPAPDKPTEAVWRELGPILDEEINRLPERFRRAFVLCQLEGKTNEAAAAELRCAPKTVSSRLTRARQRLRALLTRRGVALSTGMLAALPRKTVMAAVPAELAQMSVRTGLGYLAGRPVAQRPADLANSFLTMQTLTRWAKAAGLLAAAGVVAVALLLHLLGRPAESEAEPLQGTWKVTRVWFRGLEVPAGNLEIVFARDRFTQRGGPLPQPVLATFRVDAGKDPMQIDLFYPNGTTGPGIYRVNGDQLQLSLNPEGPERPANLGPGRFFYYELQRLPANQR